MSEFSQVTIDAATVLVIPRGVRLRRDPVRDKDVLLAPERAVALDDIAVAIIKSIDGIKSLDQIADAFAVEFGAPKQEILIDITAFAIEFVNRGLLEVAGS
jgi:pyrroloquinoline quinone biosynthesis protein D